MHILTPGKWYLIFICTKCKTRQVLFPDLSNGTSKISAIYTVACQKCDHEASYDTESIEHYQHREEVLVSRTAGRSLLDSLMLPGLRCFLEQPSILIIETPGYL